MPQFTSASEKCHDCAKSVYATEKIVVEDKEERRTYHKACLKCSHCKKVLSLGNYASMGGVYYCKPHFKQLFATKGNYDEGFGKEQHKTKWAPSAAPATSSAVSFVPVDTTPSPSASAVSSSTSSPAPARTPAPAAASTTTSTEASTTSSSSTSSSTSSSEEPAPVKKAAYAPSRPGQSFIPVESTAAAASKKETPTGIASRFKSQLEKCVGCAKTVYATEKIVVEDKEDKKVFHKTCLKCSHCSKVLSLGNYAGMGGQFFCKPHFKQLFATKGNYDEGFGKQQHKAKWIQSDDATSSSSSTQPSESLSASPSTETISSSPSTEDVKEVAHEEEHKAEVAHEEPVHVSAHEEEEHAHSSHEEESHSHHEDEESPAPSHDDEEAKDEDVPAEDN